MPRPLAAAALALAAASVAAASGAAAQQVDDGSGAIDRVHVVWMNHLDVGFTNNIASVLNIYFHEYFTKAIETAKEVNTPGS